MKIDLENFKLEVVKVEGMDGDKAMFMSRECSEFIKQLAVAAELGQITEQEAHDRLVRWLDRERASGVDHVTLVYGIGEN